MEPTLFTAQPTFGVTKPGGYASDPRQGDNDLDETEDEEVKMNCIGGNGGLQDSDPSSDEDDDSCVSNREQEEREDGVVEFVTAKLQKSSGAIRRPKPIFSRLLPTLSKHEEDEKSDSSSRGSTESPSVGARGAALSLGESNDDVDSSSSDEGDSSADESADEVSSEASRSVASEESEAIQDANDASSQSDTGENEDPDRLESFEVPETKTKCETFVKSKRVLSSNTLAQLNKEAGHSSDSPKRLRLSPHHERNDSSSPPQFSLGPPAIGSLFPLPNESNMRDSPDYSTEGEELDARLGEELERLAPASPDHAPVPLLTPPQSPLTVDLDGDITSMCEWPSNLVVDSAMMTAATETRPLSPASLMGDDSSDDDIPEPVEPSSLTPLLKSIYVGTD